MPATFRPTFNGMHRQLRLRSLRLGQDWHLEVRPLALKNEAPKFIQVKDLPPVSDHEQRNEFSPSDLPS